MTAPAPPYLLEHIVELTSQREQHALQLCLIKTLQELISADEISLYSIAAGSEKPELKLQIAVLATNPSGDPSKQRRPMAVRSIEEDPDMLQCYTTKNKIVSDVSIGEGSEAITGVKVIHPVTTVHGLIGFLMVKCVSLVQRDQDMANGFLRIYHNYQQLIDANEHDVLTGLLNRKSFDVKIMTVLSAQRSQQQRKSDNATNKETHCLAMLDIDHFKKVNDTFGHLHGDEVLLLFSRLMTKTFRTDDQLYRYGGEEFVVFLKNVDIVTGLSVLERFRAKVEAFIIPQVGTITVSIGVVEVNQQDLPTTVVEQADKALYYAKDHGRNQVFAYEILLEQGKVAYILTSGDVELF